MAHDVEMRDGDAEEEDKKMYQNLENLDENFPNRPHNNSKSLPFHTLITDLFNPLLANRKQTGPGNPIQRKRLKGGISPSQNRDNIITRFINKWRENVGHDIYPAFRLIMPDQDRDRSMYGLKEKLIATILIKIMSISKSSTDAISLLDWKLPDYRENQSAGDFSGRCLSVLSKRPLLTNVGDLTIGEVNIKLDELSKCTKENERQPIFEYFYKRMNPEELTWLIRIILRQMKIGSSEVTFFKLWHPDADILFNVSSSLKRVCWELFDPNIRLPNDQSNICLMQSFLPQYAAFQLENFDQILLKMKLTEDDNEFWIEEKLDGERIQLHIQKDENEPGGYKFKYWSRNGKDYTYLYGSNSEDKENSLTKYLKGSLNDQVFNIILDGEMISWNIEEDIIEPFGRLKSAALSEIKQNSQNNKTRPLFRIFDCLYLNHKVLTNYTLRDRRKALNSSVNSVYRRFETHSYVVGNNIADIELELRKVIQDSSEGLVIKNPRSSYQLNKRTDDWIKVKPEYMEDFGEDLDCLILGGYFGSGSRGGKISSFLCGLKPNRLTDTSKLSSDQLFWSFFKCGGGFSGHDYEEINQLTKDKWMKWDVKNPPLKYIELGGGSKFHERPDLWIHPKDSIIISVKAASIYKSNSFKTGFTLRFPRFKYIKKDKDWKTCLTTNEFDKLKLRYEKEKSKRDLKIDNERKERNKMKNILKRNNNKKDIELLDYKKDIELLDYQKDKKMESMNKKNIVDKMNLFQDLTFFVTSSSKIPKMNKGEIEDVIKEYGGTVIQTQNSFKSENDDKNDDKRDLIVLGEVKNLKINKMMKLKETNIIKPLWIFDCIKQFEIDNNGFDLNDKEDIFLLPFEPRHVYFLKDDDKEMINSNIDAYGDSYCFDIDSRGLSLLCGKLSQDKNENKNQVQRHDQKHVQFDDHRMIILQLQDEGYNHVDSIGNIFQNLKFFLDSKGIAENKLSDNTVTLPQKTENNLSDDPSNCLTSLEQSRNQQLLKHYIEFGNGLISDSVYDDTVTHIIIEKNKDNVDQIRKIISNRKRIPRIVSYEWVNECWKNQTLLDEEKFSI